MRRALTAKALIATLPVAVFLALNAGQALATHVNCGGTITQNTKLDSDLIDCPGDGIVIGADNITLDLNGHLIDGDASSPLGICETGIADVEAGDCSQPGRSGVTIKDGVVREFGIGVLLRGSHSVVRGLAVSATDSRGIALNSDSADGGNLVTHNSLSDIRFVGIEVGGPNNNVRGNSISNSGTGMIHGGFSDGSRIERNSLSNNGVAMLFSDSFGVTLVRRNVVTESQCIGIWTIETRNIRFDRNTVLRSGTGSPDEGCGDGFRVEGDNLLVGNTANENRDDGIEGSGSLVRNTANRNGDFGIEAVPGVIDGGGNRAFGNGNPLQCLNVVCR